MPNLSVKAGAKNSADILIYDYIGPEWMGMISGSAIAEALSEMNGLQQINVRINSGGGYIFEGLAIYNLLKNHSAQVIVDIDGAALSIASVIAMAGDRIRMAKNAMFMIHDPWGAVSGNSADLRREADVLDQLKGNLVDVYVARSGKDAEAITQMMSDETWFQADAALAEKFVDEVTENKSALAASGMDLSFFNNVPTWAKAKAPQAKTKEQLWRVKNARLRLEQSKRTA